MSIFEEASFADTQISVQSNERLHSLALECKTRASEYGVVYYQKAFGELADAIFSYQDDLASRFDVNIWISRLKIEHIGQGIAGWFQKFNADIIVTADAMCDEILSGLAKYPPPKRRHSGKQRNTKHADAKTILKKTSKQAQATRIQPSKKKKPPKRVVKQILTLKEQFMQLSWKDLCAKTKRHRMAMIVHAFHATKSKSEAEINQLMLVNIWSQGIFGNERMSSTGFSSAYDEIIEKRKKTDQTLKGKGQAFYCKHQSIVTRFKQMVPHKLETVFRELYPLVFQAHVSTQNMYERDNANALPMGTREVSYDDDDYDDYDDYDGDIGLTQNMNEMNKANSMEMKEPSDDEQDSYEAKITIEQALNDTGLTHQQIKVFTDQKFESIQDIHDLDMDDLTQLFADMGTRKAVARKLGIKKNNEAMILYDQLLSSMNK